MFNLKREVPSLELCKKLKELGFPQTDGGWYWSKWYGWYDEQPQLVFSPDGERFGEWIDEHFIKYYPPDECYKAPTFPEIIDWIPNYIYISDGNISCPNEIIDKGWWAMPDSNLPGRKVIVKDIIYGKEIEFLDTLLNSYAKLLIWLAENNYINFNREK